LVTTIFHQIFRGKTRAVSMALLAFVIAITGTSFIGGGTARADVYPGQITHIYMNLDNNPSRDLQSQYYGLIRSLRETAGHWYRDGVLETELNNAYNRANGLIELTLSYNGTTLTIWISPGDLYVRGFTNQHDHTFQFNDSDYSLYNNLNVLPGHPTGGYTTLPFGSNYNSMSGRNGANRGRDHMPISFNDMFNSVYHLAYTTDPFGSNTQAVARSVMMMVQFTSEAARFNRVFDIMSRIMLTRSITYLGLPSLEFSLENKWNAISTFGFNITQNPSTPPRYISPQVGTIYTWSDVARFLAVLLNNGNLNLPQEGPSGNWDHTEL
jgi:hypothetical protein